jgi:hypothetical protein
MLENKKCQNFNSSSMMKSRRMRCGAYEEMRNA